MRRKIFKVVVWVSWLVVLAATFLANRADHAFVAAQQNLTERARAHGRLVAAAFERQAAFRESHPDQTTASTKRAAELRAETSRLIAEQEILVSKMAAGPGPPS